MPLSDFVTDAPPEGRYLIRNVKGTPVQDGPNEGVVFPYWTADVDGESIPAAFDEKTLPSDNAAPIPEGMQVVDYASWHAAYRQASKAFREAQATITLTRGAWIHLAYVLEYIAQTDDLREQVGLRLDAEEVASLREQVEAFGEPEV